MGSSVHSGHPLGLPTFGVDTELDKDLCRVLQIAESMRFPQDQLGETPELRNLVTRILDNSGLSDLGMSPF